MLADPDSSLQEQADAGSMDDERETSKSKTSDLGKQNCARSHSNPIYTDLGFELT
jgi:hypothetical protein